MRKLQDIAADYCKVKNYVYQRYGGINSLPKLYPGYTVQNEMSKCGLRAQLNMPSVYFYLAIFDAIGDIKTQWTQVKSKVLANISRNQQLTPDECHYLRFVLKVSGCMEAILSGEVYSLPQELQKRRDELVAEVDPHKLDHYLRRQVRRHLRKLHTDSANGFSVTERAYRYGDHGIYISTKKKRERLYIPLTDNNQYKRQLFVRLYPEQAKVEIQAPVDVRIRKLAGYDRQIGLAAGMFVMFTTDAGHCYGEDYYQYHSQLAEWIRFQSIQYNSNKLDNPGRKKYYAKKKRLDAGLHTYINQEINRLLKTEKPKIIYIPKPPLNSQPGPVKQINQSVSLWQRGYIRARLEQKCREQSIRIVEVPGKDISSQCSECSCAGTRNRGMFQCKTCGYQIEEKINTAKNIKKRGLLQWSQE